MGTLVAHSLSSLSLSLPCPLAAPAFTSSTAPETAARALLPLLSMEVAPQHQGGWCCDEKLKTGYSVINLVSNHSVACSVKFRDFPPCQRWEHLFNTNSTICKCIFMKSNNNYPKLQDNTLMEF